MGVAQKDKPQMRTTERFKLKIIKELKKRVQTGHSKHAAAVVRRLSDHEEPVREAAVAMLTTLAGSPDNAALEQHVETIVEMVETHDDEAVCEAASRVLDFLDEMPGE